MTIITTTHNISEPIPITTTYIVLTPPNDEPHSNLNLFPPSGGGETDSPTENESITQTTGYSLTQEFFSLLVHIIFIFALFLFFRVLQNSKFSGIYIFYFNVFVLLFYSLARIVFLFYPQVIGVALRFFCLEQSLIWKVYNVWIMGILLGTSLCGLYLFQEKDHQSFVFCIFFPHISLVLIQAFCALSYVRTFELKNSDKGVNYQGIISFLYCLFFHYKRFLLFILP